MALKIAVIGAGNIGGALLGGIVKSRIAAPKDIVAIDASDEIRRRAASQWKVKTSPSTTPKAIEGRGIIFLAVKPHTIPAVLQELRGNLRRGQVIVSVAAGVPISLMESIIGKKIPIFRVMPNIPVVVEEGACGIAGNRATTSGQRKMVEKIFGTLGTAVSVDEAHLDAVTGLSGSGPAYVYVFIEALIDGGKKAGLPHDIARRLAEQTVLGAAKLVRDSKRHPAALRDEVVTPGGTTIAGLHELERHGFRSTVINAVEAASIRSKELGILIAERFAQGPTKS
jgi:pyrroline-5-carboxylate reductase